MSSFTHATSFRPINNLWEVTDSFCWYLEKNSNVVIEIPNGYIFNGADIPFPFTTFWPRVHPGYIQAACLHDYLLDTLRHIFSREYIDKIFFQSLKVVENKPFRNWCMYQAVKAWGIANEREQYFDIKVK